MSNYFEECSEVGDSDKGKFWQVHIEAWKQSGKTQSDFCRDSGLSIKTFGYWKRKQCNKKPSAVGFVPVSIKSSGIVATDTGTLLRLVVSNSYGIDIGDGFNPVTLIRLLDIVERRV